MHRKYKQPIAKAFPDIKVIEPKISKFVLLLCRIAGRIYLFFFYGIAKIVMKEDRFLFDAFKRSLAGESRCIIAFRHPNGGEPSLLSWYFLFKLRVVAARNGIKFKQAPHAVFIYGYEVARWGGGIARFVMPNIGAMPIHHSKMDSKGMARIYDAITNGPFPVAIAPEGQVSYSGETVPRLEPGVIRIGFNAAERIKEKGGDYPLEILPVSVHFRFGSWGKLSLEPFLKKIERTCGINKKNRKLIPFTERLKQCRDHIIEVNEKRYKIEFDPSLSFAERLDKVINVALETAERMMGLKSEGDFFSRLYRARQHFWDQIFIPGIESFKGLSFVERNVNDLKAGEAWYIERHLELVDFGWYFRIPIIPENSELHKKIEYTQNLWDFASRTMGGAFNNRINIYPRKVIIQAAPAINLSQRLPHYKSDKKAAIEEALESLKKAYTDSINEANDPNWINNLKN